MRMRISLKAELMHISGHGLQTHDITINRNGNFGLVFGWGGNTTHIHDFCIPVDFLGIKDLQKNRKRPNFFSKATDKATATLIEIL